MDQADMEAPRQTLYSHDNLLRKLDRLLDDLMGNSNALSGQMNNFISTSQLLSLANSSCSPFIWPACCQSLLLEIADVPCSQKMWKLQNMRRLMQLTWLNHNNRTPVVALSLDTEKAFDSADLRFLMYAMLYFLIWERDDFPLENAEIKGVHAVGWMHKLFMYADDSLVVMVEPNKSLCDTSFGFRWILSGMTYLGIHPCYGLVFGAEGQGLVLNNSLISFTCSWFPAMRELKGYRLLKPLPTIPLCHMIHLHALCSLQPSW